MKVDKNKMIEIVKYDNIELMKGDCLDAMKVLEDKKRVV